MADTISRVDLELLREYVRLDREIIAPHLAFIVAYRNSVGRPTSDEEEDAFMDSDEGRAFAWDFQGERRGGPPRVPGSGGLQFVTNAVFYEAINDRDNRLVQVQLNHASSAGGRLIQSAIREFREGGDPASTEETFETTDENEAASFLLNRQQGVLACLNERIIEGFFNLDNTSQANITKISAPDEHLLINFLLRRPDLLPFFAIRTPYLSLLVPKIRLYKKIYKKNNDGSYSEIENGILEFKFKSFTENKSLERITQSKSGRAGGAGIKNVNWSYEGNNPETVRSFVNFDISLFFQSLSDFIGVSADDAQAALEDHRNTDLISLIGAGVGIANGDDESAQPLYKYEILAHVGWEIDHKINHDLAADQKIRDLKAVINQTNTRLRLSLKDHNLNFNADGTLTLDISYFSAIDEYFSDESLNILRIGLPPAIESVNQATTNAETEQADPADRQELDPCATSRTSTNDNSTDTDTDELSERDAALLDALRTTGNDNIIQNYNNIFTQLLSGNKLWKVSISREAIEEIRAAEVNESINPFSDAFKSLEIRRLTEGVLMNLSTSSQFTVEQVTLRPETGIDADDVAEDAAAAAAPDLSETDLDALQRRRLLDNYSESGGGQLVINFIRLGDIIDSVVEGLKNTEGTALQERSDDFEFITGLYTYRDMDNTRKAYNYSDMLISIDGFRSFFIEKIIRPLKTRYSLTTFIKDLASKFSYVNSIRLASSGDIVSPEGVPYVASFEGPDIGISDHLRDAATRDAIFGGPGLMPDLQAGIDYNKSIADSEPVYAGPVGKVISAAPSSGEQRAISYFILRSNGQIIEREADEEEDARTGIYHVKLGSDRGILKSIQFRKDEIQGRREGRIVRAGGLNLSALREKYDATITIFGAPFIFPGTYIYINPSMVGYGHGSTSAARVLGLGGYYFINKVINSIGSDGKFETEIEASWEAFSGTRCNRPELEIIRVGSNAADEALQASIPTAEGTSDTANEMPDSYQDALQGASPESPPLPTPAQQRYEDAQI
jgi:hypothetical protein